MSSSLLYILILVVVTIGCSGIPLPSAAVLVGAAIYASTTHQLDITLVIACAATGATLGAIRRTHLVASVCGAVAWATTIGSLSYSVGDNSDHLLRPEGIAGLVLVLLLVMGLVWVLRRAYKRLTEEAEQALPGPLSAYWQSPPMPQLDGEKL